MGHRKGPFRRTWAELNASPTDVTGASLRRWRQGRGYGLERLLVKLARAEGLDAEPSFRVPAEQIDGYFAVDHHHFLLEAKWQNAPVTASDVFAFQGKLRGKLLGTLGLFVSISGFGIEAPLALAFGKDLDVLLADRTDIELVLDDHRTFQEMVRVKMRAAAQRGDVYYAYQRWLDVNP